MKYQSTRGKVRGRSFEEALSSGYAADGGLFMPEEIPKVSPDTLKKWSRLTYVDLVKEILPLFISEEEMSRSEINGVVDRAFSTFTRADAVCTQRLKNGLNILELFHGPTLAFKDLALSCIGQLYEHFLSKREKHITIIVGTSGDTGSAAIHSVKALKWADIIVLLPKDKCTRIQELQMTTVVRENVHVFRVEGNSDELDLPIKQCFEDQALVQKYNLSSINSINWARIMIQIAHYFYSYFQLDPECQGQVEIVVPTGALGNITGGLLAREMGLPVRLTCAVNSNDIVHRVFSKGDYSVRSNCIESFSSAMDIMNPYNMERIFYLANGRNPDQICQIMEEFGKDEKYQVPSSLLSSIDIGSRSVNDAGTLAAMRQCWEENEYLPCPHTATAISYHYDKCHREGQPAIPRMCVATASPDKFEQAVLSAGLTPQPNGQLQALESLPVSYTDMNRGDDWLKMLKDEIEKIHSRLS